MKYLIRNFALGTIPVVLLMILAFTNIIDFDFSENSVKIINVSQMQKDTEKPRKVKINGEVKQIVPLLESIAYQVEDKTGSIWVISENKPPQMGNQIIVKGTLQHQSIPIGEEDLGEYYIIEEKPNAL